MHNKDVVEPTANLETITAQYTGEAVSFMPRSQSLSTGVPRVS
jgi:hypothetical protein